MLLEQLLGLPTGTRVVGEIGLETNLSGVIDSLKDGCRFIRWEDGWVTAPLGRMQDVDEFIAAHTRLAPARSRLGDCHSGIGGASQTVNEGGACAEAAKGSVTIA